MDEIDYLRLKVKCADLLEENNSLKNEIKDLKEKNKILMNQDQIDKYIETKIESIEIRNAEFKTILNKKCDEAIAKLETSLVTKFETEKEYLETLTLASPSIYEEHVLFDFGFTPLKI